LDVKIAMVYMETMRNTFAKDDFDKVDLLATAQAENVQLRMEMQLQLARQQEIIAGLREENQMLLRRLYGNRTERTNTAETQLAFDDLVKSEMALQAQLDEARKMAAFLENASAGANGADAKGKGKTKPKGRRNLAQSTLPRIEVEIDDPELEGKCPRKGFDYSYQLYLKSAQYAVLVKKTVKYEVSTPQGTAELSAPQPLSLFKRGLLHTSTVADIMVRKFSRGEPLARQEKHFVTADSAIDRGTMSRYLEEAGNTFGSTVVEAMWNDAIHNAGVISTDATGAAIQPEGVSQVRMACKKGHFFTAVVDDSAVLFRYVPDHNQKTVKTLFGEFRGFLQADAHHVYNILEKPTQHADGQPSGTVTLVGCWAHTRRYFFEAALCRHRVGVQGLMRIQAIYALDRGIMKLPRADRARTRDELLRPLMVDFFNWARESQHEAPRSLAARAIGYAINQESELMAVLLNIDLPLDNNRAERSLRKIVVGRKNWLFYGSDCHAESAAAIFSLIATCRMHGVEPQQYLDELMRVLPYWPRDRHLELAPQNWAATRARLAPAELDKPVSRITVPLPE
jgi:transposase